MNYPSLKNYLNSNTITNYLEFLEDNYGTLDINSQNIDSDYNNYFSIMTIFHVLHHFDNMKNKRNSR